MSTYYAIVLFDTGASHSFISARFARGNNLWIESMDEEWQKQLLSRGTTITNQIYKDCNVEVQEWIMKGNLIIEKMNDFMSFSE